MPIIRNFQPMFTQTSNVTNNLAVSLLTHYSFDLGGYSASELVKRWEKEYPSNWVHLAAIEALYQGRYKAISVQQILTLWLRRNHPSYHFNFEFERLICNKLPEDLKWNTSPPALPTVKPTANNNSTIKDAMRDYRLPQALNSSYQKNLQKQEVREQPQEAKNYHTREIVSAKAEENFNRENRSKALPASSGIVLSTSKSQKSTITKTESRTLTETKNHIVKDGASNQLEELEESQSSKKPLIPKNLAKLLPPARNHPPIEQFTPEKSDSSETFTSKLKAIVTEN